MIQQALVGLNISSLNEMQEKTLKAVSGFQDAILLSPTGTGKTLAFLLPLLECLNPDLKTVQGLVIAPSRELAIQIEQVFKRMGTGMKSACFYGGHSFKDELNTLKEPPLLLTGTPGRIADHLRRKSFDTKNIMALVLDEFDKSLELGFHKDLEKIVFDLPSVKQTLLTSATKAQELPGFIKLKEPVTLDFIPETPSTSLAVKVLRAEENDKLEALTKLLSFLNNENTLIFCNHKEAVERISQKLKLNKIGHDVFHGDLNQADRLKALVKFRNGTHRFLITSDLASRGLDIPQIQNVVHYQIPLSKNAYIHRNGRTARMHAKGTSFLILSENEPLPDFIENEPEQIDLNDIQDITPPQSEWETLYISAGKKDKIGKGDILGTLIQKADVSKDDVGAIEIFENAAYVAIKKGLSVNVVQKLQKEKIKKKTIRIEIAK